MMAGSMVAWTAVQRVDWKAWWKAVPRDDCWAARMADLMAVRSEDRSAAHWVGRWDEHLAALTVFLRAGQMAAMWADLLAFLWGVPRVGWMADHLAGQKARLKADSKASKTVELRAVTKAGPTAYVKAVPRDDCWAARMVSLRAVRSEDRSAVHLVGRWDEHLVAPMVSLRAGWRAARWADLLACPSGVPKADLMAAHSAEPKGNRWVDPMVAKREFPSAV